MRSFINEKSAIGILAILYLVGYISIGLEVMYDVVYLTPLNLLISLLIAKAFDSNNTATFLKFAIPSFVIGYGIEVLGVQTGAIFGEYAYGSILGFKLWETPLMIGINWVLVCYICGYAVNAVASSLAMPLKAALASTLLVALDFIIEPVAIKWGMWTWSAAEVPLQNYIAWWIIGFMMMLIFYACFKDNKNNVAVAVLIIQTIFFGLLNL